MSRDNVRSMKVDNVASGTPQPFGMVPTALETVAPAWFGQAAPRARYYPSAATRGAEEQLYGVRDEADHRQQELFLLVPAPGWLREGGFTF